MSSKSLSVKCQAFLNEDTSGVIKKCKTRAVKGKNGKFEFCKRHLPYEENGYYTNIQKDFVNSYSLSKDEKEDFTRCKSICINGKRCSRERWNGYSYCKQHESASIEIQGTKFNLWY